MPYGMLFVIAVVLLLGWLHSSRKEAARQDADRRIVPVVLDAVFQEVQFAPNGRITCFGESGLPLPQYDRMTGGEHVRAKYRGYEVEHRTGPGCQLYGPRRPHCGQCAVL